jgi:Family of unknown function (DUF6416)
VSNDFITTTVSVPVERLAEFHAMFGRWLASTDTTIEPVKPGPGQARPWTDRDQAVAVQLYGEVSDGARRVLDFCAARPGEWITGTDLATAVGVDGPMGLAGTLSSVGKAAAKLAREVPYDYEAGEPGTSGRYRLSHPMARLLNGARTPAPPETGVRVRGVAQQTNRHGPDTASRSGAYIGGGLSYVYGSALDPDGHLLLSVKGMSYRLRSPRRTDWSQGYVWPGAETIEQLAASGLIEHVEAVVERHPAVQKSFEWWRAHLAEVDHRLGRAGHPRSDKEGESNA